MIDIRLRDVQVLWDYRGQEPDAPSILVMGHPDESGKDQYGNQDDPDYHSAWGTRSADLVGLSDEEWTSKLFEQFHSLVCFEGLVPRIVHEAFCVIPEYRVCLIWRGRASHIPPDRATRPANR